MKKLEKTLYTFRYADIIKTYPATRYHDSVAQLGERYLDRVEVAGSSPVRIIPKTRSSFDERVFFVVKKAIPLIERE